MTEAHPPDDDRKLLALDASLMRDPAAYDTYQQFVQAAETHEQPFHVTRRQWQLAAGIGACIMLWCGNAIINLDGPAKPIEGTSKARPSASAPAAPSTTPKTRPTGQWRSR